MKTATISQTKNHLGALLDTVKHGESILIMDRNQPVARIEAIRKMNNEEERDYLVSLEQQGLIRRGKRPVNMKWMKKGLVEVKNGGCVLSALLDEREETR